MLNIIVCICIGLFIGWNIPQPSWAKKIQDFIKNKFISK